MKARLKSGEIIELVKDCECITHEGPHFLHMNSLDKEQSQKYLDMKTNGGSLAFAQNEINRLNRLFCELRARKIVELIEE